MKKCNRCNVFINSSDNICPLCKSIIKDDKVDDVFPVINKGKNYNDLVEKIINFSCVFAILVCLAINVLVSKKVSWSWFVLCAIGSFYITIKLAIKYRKSYMTCLFIELFTVTLIAILWDYFTKFHGWSINYVLPFICISYTITALVIWLFTHNSIKNYIIYISFSCLIGLLPIVFMFLGLLKIVWPSILSVIVSLFSLCFLIFFKNRLLKSEFMKRFHI